MAPISMQFIPMSEVFEFEESDAPIVPKQKASEKTTSKPASSTIAIFQPSFPFPSSSTKAYTSSSSSVASWSYELNEPGKPRMRHYSLSNISFHPSSRNYGTSLKRSTSLHEPSQNLEASFAGVAITPAGSFLRRFYCNTHSNAKNNSDYSSNQNDSSNPSAADAAIGKPREWEEGIQIDSYVVGDCLTQGTFASIWSASSLSPPLCSRPLAMKVVRRNDDQPQTYDIFRQEILLWSILSHPNIVPLLDWFTVDEYAVAVMPLCRQSLLDYRTEHTKLHPRSALLFIRDLFSALTYLHHNDIAHNDIKLENILINETDNGTSAMLCDFGLAYRFKRASPSVSTSVSSTSEMARQCTAGSVLYSSPEKLTACADLEAAEEGKSALQEFYFSPYHQICLMRSSDVWAAGVVAYCLVEGTFPFYDEYTPRTIMKIRSGKYKKPSSSRESEIHEDAKLVHRIIESCLQLRVEDRPAAREVLEWLEQHVRNIVT